MRKKPKLLLLGLLCMVLVLQIPLGKGNPCEETGSEGFVSAAGVNLCLNGNQFKMVGGNSYGIMGGYLGVGSINRLNPNGTARFRDASQYGLRVLRFWLDMANSDYWFSQVYSTYNRTQDHSAYFSGLDQLVTDAKSNGVYLVPVLASAYDQWTSIGGGQSFWKIGSETNLRFKAWARSIVGRYSGERQIAWWETSNEPNYPSGRVDPGSYVDWASDMVGLIKSVDRNHLVSGGLSNTGDLDLGKWGLLNRPFDILTIHVYERDLYRIEAANQVANSEEAVRQFITSYSSYSLNVARKPLIFEEFNGDNLTTPPWFVDRFLNYALPNSNGAFIWSWEEGNPSMSRYVSPTVTPLVAETLSIWSKTLPNLPVT